MRLRRVAAPLSLDGGELPGLGLGRAGRGGAGSCGLRGSSECGAGRRRLRQVCGGGWFGLGLRLGRRCKRGGLAGQGALKPHHAPPHRKANAPPRARPRRALRCLTFIFSPWAAFSGLDNGPMAKEKTIYTCNECGATSPKWLGRCPGCEAWNSLIEGVAEPSGGRQEPPLPIPGQGQPGGHAERDRGGGHGAHAPRASMSWTACWVAASWPGASP